MKGYRPPKRGYTHIVAEMPNGDGKTAYDTKAGRRMLALCKAVIPWHDVYDKHQPWNSAEAAERARAWVMSDLWKNVGSPLILMGRRVSRAFNLPSDFEWLEWYRSPEHGHPMVPLPSLSSSWWRDTRNAEEAHKHLKLLAHGKLPRTDHKATNEEA